MLANRERILQATRELSLTDGFRALTMRKVAAAVGVTAPALYRHYKNKSALIEALLDEARDSFLGYVNQSAEPATPWQRLQAAQAAYLQFARERPDAYELLMMTPNQFGMFGMPNSLETWSHEPPPAFQVCVDRVAECMRSGDLAASDPHQVALTLSACAHGLIAQFLAGRFGDDRAAFETLYHECLGHVYRGLRPTSPSA